MLSIPESVRIFVARTPADFRRQFDGLAAIARDDLGMDPFGGHVFVFFNKRRDRIKLLVLFSERRKSCCECRRYR